MASCLICLASLLTSLKHLRIRQKIDLRSIQISSVPYTFIRVYFYYISLCLRNIDISFSCLKENPWSVLCVENVMEECDIILEMSWNYLRKNKWSPYLSLNKGWNLFWNTSYIQGLHF